MTVAYPGRPHPALDDVCLTIRPGERLVVTGPSGAGKSSLLALLLRFIQPAAGTIQAGGADAGHARRRSVAGPDRLGTAAARTCSRAAPRTTLPWASPARAATTSSGRPGWRARRSSSRPCPAGTDAELGERALRLSAGQRQRIALARAFLRDAPLLLLDEPTAHLDPVSARQIAEVLDTVLADRTVVLVTHQLADGPGWAAGAGRVIRLERGRLVAEQPARPAAVPAAVTR